MITALEYNSPLEPEILRLPVSDKHIPEAADGTAASQSEAVLRKNPIIGTERIPRAPDPFAYDDYRLLLKHLYLARKKQDPRFSCRGIAQRAGFKSVGFFSQIVNGKTNISLTSVLKLAQVFRLKGDALEYFECLVQANQSKAQADSDHFGKRLQSLRRRKLKVASPDQLEMFSRWYCPAIRELAGFTPIFEDYQALGDALVPRVSAEQAKEAVDLLLRLGLMRRVRGRLERAGGTLTTGETWQSSAVEQFQRSALDLARRGEGAMPRELRSQSTVSVSISAAEFERIREEMDSMRRKILEIASQAQAPDRVYQVIFHAYPMSRIGGPDPDPGSHFARTRPMEGGLETTDGRASGTPKPRDK